MSTDNDLITDIQWIRIYNRWGDLVMEKENGNPNDPTFGWDGTESGETLNPGVYTWQIHFTYDDGKEKILFGNVTLVK